MTIQIPAAGIVKEQTFCTDKRVSIIYGYNNHGKTTILRTISQVLCQRVTEDFIFGRDFVLSVYIPTNRLIVRKTQTDDFRPRDIEEFVYYQEDALNDFGLHLKRIRDYLQADQNARHLTVRILQTIFEKSVTDLSVRHSDGIENIINLFSCILWAMTWDTDLSVMTPQQFDTLISEKEICVLIDELEMFLHVNVQARLIKSLTETFPNCHFIMTTHSPLLLTRYRNLCVYNISDGILHPVEGDLYYKDLDIVYESWFDVDEYPWQVREDINYLGQISLGIEIPDSARVRSISERMNKDYPNLHARYNRLIVKALQAGETHDKHQTHL